MNILIVTHSFPPHPGGIERVAYEQAKGLAGQGHGVCVVTSNRDNVLPEEGMESFHVTRVPCFNPLWGFGPAYIFFHPRLPYILAEKTRWADVVLAHGHPYLSSFLAARAARKAGKPFFLVQHNTFIEYPFPLNWLERLNDWLVGRYSLSAAKKVVCVSKATETYVKAVCPSARTVVLYNGVDLQKFAPAKDKATVRKTLGIPLDKFVVFTVRTLSFKNGIDFLLGAARQLKDREDLLFLVAGNGPDKAKILAAASGLPNFRVLGFVSDEQLPAHYQAADLFVLPSRSGEGFPLAVLEALSSGLPVIATDAGGQREIIQNEVNGFLVKPDVQAIVEKARLLQADRPLLSRLSLNARKCIEGKLDWLHHIQQMIEMVNG